MSDETVRRLRLVLGAFADAPLGGPLGDGAGELADLDRHLGYLHDRAYAEGRGTLGVEKLMFRARRRRRATWRVILLVDPSGSMLDSIVYSAVLGAIFAEVPESDLRLVAFDTQVVDIRA